MMSSVPLLAAVLCAALSHASLAPAILDARNYSSWMLEGIMASGAGIGSSGAPTGQIELGLFQEALRQSSSAMTAGVASSDLPRARRMQSYLQQSISTSNATGFSNLTRDLSEPLDRLSIGRSLIVGQQQNVNFSTLADIAALQHSVVEQPRNDNGGLWYYDDAAKLAAYHNLSYLDGMFSYAPFTTLLPSVYSNLSAEAALEQVGEQLDILYRRCHHNDSGLLVHGYDAAKTHPWADPVTGASPIVWSRSLAWFTVGLVDSLDIAATLYPDVQSNSDAFFRLLRYLNQLASAQIRAVEMTVRLTDRNALYQVVTRPGAPGNFVESSGTALIAYALAKAARTGLLVGDSLKQRAAIVAQKMFADLTDHFVIHNANGTLSFNGTSSVASLSVNNVSYEYYITRPITLNSLIGTSAFVLAGLEVAQL